jgi:hypothetical protein
MRTIPIVFIRSVSVRVVLSIALLTSSPMSAGITQPAASRITLTAILRTAFIATGSTVASTVKATAIA